MRRLLKGLLLVGVLGGVAFGGVMYMTADLTVAADGFFKALKSQDAVKARSYLAQETNQKLDDRTLKQVMETQSIVAYREASFPNRHVSGARGELNGTFTTTSGGVVPVRVVLVQEADAWKVLTFQTGK